MKHLSELMLKWSVVLDLVQGVELVLVRVLGWGLEQELVSVLVMVEALEQELVKEEEQGLASDWVVGQDLEEVKEQDWEAEPV